MTYVPPFHAKPLGTVKLAVAAGTVYEAGVLVTFGLNCAVTEMEAPGANPGAGTVMAEDPPALNLDDENAPRGLLSPRKLDMDQEVVLAASALSPGGEEEKQEVQPTQPQQIAADEEEEEEGELPPPAMERTMSVNFGPYVV